MKRKTLMAVIAAVLTIAMACPAMAANPSRTNGGTRGSSGHGGSSSSRSTGTVRVINTIKGTDITYGVQNSTSAGVKVTNIAESVNANNTYNTANANLSYADKASRVMSNGVTYAGNAYANAIYTAAEKTGNTVDFLNKLNPNMSTQIAAKKSGFDASKYTLLSVFNMTASAAANTQVANGKTAKIDFEIPGVKAGGDYIVVGVTGDLGDIDAVQKQLSAGSLAGSLNVNGDVFTASAPADGKLSVDVSKYTTMLVLARK